MFAIIIYLEFNMHGGNIMYFRCVYFRDELGFLNCDDIYMYVVNKQLELLLFVF